VIRLAKAPSVGHFDADTYDYTLKLGRFGYETTFGANLHSTTLVPLAGDREPDGDVDGNDVLLWQRTLPPAAAGLASIRANFGQNGSAGPDYSLAIDATALPNQDTIPTFTLTKSTELPSCFPTGWTPTKSSSLTSTSNCGRSRR
jgi:hypothetical protein